VVGKLFDSREMALDTAVMVLLDCNLDGCGVAGGGEGGEACGHTGLGCG